MRGQVSQQQIRFHFIVLISQGIANAVGSEVGQRLDDEARTPCRQARQASIVSSGIDNRGQGHINMANSLLVPALDRD